MTDRDGSTVRVDTTVVERQPQFLQTTQNLGREGLVDLDDVEVLEFKAGPIQYFLRGKHRPQPHDPRRHSRRRSGEEAAERVCALRLADLTVPDQ